MYSEAGGLEEPFKRGSDCSVSSVGKKTPGAGAVLLSATVRVVTYMMILEPESIRWSLAKDTLRPRSVVMEWDVRGQEIFHASTN